MPSDSGETRRTTTRVHGGAGVALQPSAEQEQLPCPRCDSTNTKFCYYNNYNFSQPRHFCKSCRRYWTHGGTLRDIPVGGGSRKSAKRSRTSSAVTVASTTSVVPSSSAGNRDVPLPATPILFPSAASVGGNHLAAIQIGGDAKGGALSLCSSFTSLMNGNSAVTSHGPGGIIGLNGFGLGLGPGLEDMGFGLGRSVWPMGDGIAGGVGCNGGPAAPIPATWQLESLDTNAGFIAGDCFAWSDLAISTPGNTHK